MMAIIVSTADSLLINPATNLTRDVYQRYVNINAEERQILFISRACTCIRPDCISFLVSQFKTVLNAAFTAYNIYGASLTPALLATFLWKRATKGCGRLNNYGCWCDHSLDIFSSLAGMVLAMHPFLQELTYPAAGLSVIVLIVVSLITPAPSKEVYSNFLMTMINFKMVKITKTDELDDMVIFTSVL